MTCTTGAVVELNCETDFVGMNEKFKAYAEKIAKAALAAKPADVDALKAAVIDGETVEDDRHRLHPCNGREHAAGPRWPWWTPTLCPPTSTAAARSAFW